MLNAGTPKNSRISSRMALHSFFVFTENEQLIVQVNIEEECVTAVKC